MTSCMLEPLPPVLDIPQEVWTQLAENGAPGDCVSWFETAGFHRVTTDGDRLALSWAPAADAGT